MEHPENKCQSNHIIYDVVAHCFLDFKFKNIVKTGELDKEFLKIYEDAKVKAEALLLILEDEKEKRTKFSYKTLPQANKEPAEKSIENAQFFVTHIKAILKEKWGAPEKWNARYHTGFWHMDRPDKLRKINKQSI